MIEVRRRLSGEGATGRRSLKRLCRALIDSGHIEVAFDSWPGHRCTATGLKLYGLPNFKTECQVSAGSPVLVERPINGPSRP